MQRKLLAAVLSVGLTMSTTGAVSAREEHQSFTANGTVLRIVPAASLQEAMNAVNGQFGTEVRMSTDDGRGADTRYAAFRTNDITGEHQIIWIDLSWLKDSDFGSFVDLADREAIQIELLEQPEGSFLGIQYWELSKGSQVNNTDWGIEEGYNSRDDSINARVDNGPDDDEARNQGDKFDTQGRRTKED